MFLRKFIDNLKIALTSMAVAVLIAAITTSTLYLFRQYIVLGAVLCVVVAMVLATAVITWLED